MATRYDLENFFDDMETFIKANLNTKIAELDAEKDDDITLKQIKTGAYFIQSLDERSVSFDPYCIFGIVNLEPIPTDGWTADGVTMQVVIVVADPGTGDILKRVLRYQRALREIFEQNWEKFNKRLKLNVSKTIPVELTQVNTGNRYQAIGVNIETCLP